MLFTFALAHTVQPRHALHNIYRYLLRVLTSTLSSDVTRLYLQRQVPLRHRFLPNPYNSTALLIKCYYVLRDVTDTTRVPVSASRLQLDIFYLLKCFHPSGTLFCRKDPVSVPTVRPWRKAKSPVTTRESIVAQSKKPTSPLLIVLLRMAKTMVSQLHTCTYTQLRYAM
ncbi:hypothetical protein P3342_000847 [Pyrenophora teres f. teres]|nr:hypothetical protein P3342_000847 [Pyrenophora teres f. teres]